MPEASAWQELCRWEFGPVEEREEDNIDDSAWVEDTSSEANSQISGLTQKDRDNRVILLASGKNYV